MVVEGVDVVADNAAGLSVSLRTGRCALLVLMWRRCRRRHRKVGCVVPDNIDAGVGSVSRSMHRPETQGPPTKSARPQIKESS